MFVFISKATRMESLYIFFNVFFFLPIYYIIHDVMNTMAPPAVQLVRSVMKPRQLPSERTSDAVN